MEELYKMLKNSDSELDDWRVKWKLIKNVELFFSTIDEVKEVSDDKNHLLEILCKYLKNENKFQMILTESSVEITDNNNLIFSLILKNDRFELIDTTMVEDSYDRRLTYEKNLGQFFKEESESRFSTKFSNYTKYIKHEGKYRKAQTRSDIIPREQSNWPKKSHEGYLLEKGFPLIKYTSEAYESYKFGDQKIDKDKFNVLKNHVIKQDKIIFDDLKEIINSSTYLSNDLNNLIEKLSSYKMPQYFEEKITKYLYQEFKKTNRELLKADAGKSYNLESKEKHTDDLVFKIFVGYVFCDLYVYSNELNKTIVKYSLDMKKDNDKLIINENKGEKVYTYYEGHLREMNVTEDDKHYTIYINQSNEAIVAAFDPKEGMTHYYAPKFRIKQDRINSDFNYCENFYFEAISKDTFRELKDNTTGKKRKLYKYN